ncbi:MAG TPA: alpha/beta fold hydrolase [Anaerolineales bacterium]|nr:alpha/beta fold hydrolase [Anaerolineales bacterium]
MNLLAYFFLVLILYFAAVFAFAFSRLYSAHINPAFKTPQNKFTGNGRTFEESHETESHTVLHTVEDGIERIVYTPKQRKYETPILMAHGMWHGAWCWEAWQKLFAEWGWESVAYSLPGHARSPLQRPVWLCTHDYYLAFLCDEVNRLPRKPILMGHSMGGAQLQWYLRHIGNDLPAVVLVAPWTSHTAVKDSMPMFLKVDPLGCVLVGFTLDARPYVRSPQAAARKLISDGAIYSPEELFARLDTESLLVTLQHNPPFWKPAENVKAPVLLLAGEKDAVVGVEPLRRSAAHYKAEFVPITEAGHNLMMERSHKDTAQKINNWLIQHNVS